jgi:hypothetical protein
MGCHLRVGEMPEHCRFVFAIPLKPRLAADDWEQAQEDLRRTIRSIRGSRSKNYVIVIACHESPDVKSEADRDIYILTVPFAPETDIRAGHLDKARKRHFIGAWLREHFNGEDMYVMFLDADDLIHRDLVDYIVKDDNRRSYVVESGYEYDCGTGILARRTKEFHQGCGSCFVVYFRQYELPSTWEDEECAYSRFKGHKEYNAVAKDMGKDADPIPFYCVAYLANHGESLRLKKTGKLRELDLGNLIWPTRANEILKTDFSVGVADRRALGLAGVRSFTSNALSMSLHRGKRRALRYLLGTSRT